jgi:hypothetical protein
LDLVADNSADERATNYADRAASGDRRADTDADRATDDRAPLSFHWQWLSKYHRGGKQQAG